MNQDLEHLKLLSVFYYVMAGFACLIPLLALVYIGMGVAILTGTFGSSTPAARSGDMVGAYFFIGFGVLFALVGITGAVLNILVGRSLARHERRTFCQVIAALNCFHMPLGTLLGVFTLVVLARPSVQALFEANAGGASAMPGPPGAPWPSPSGAAGPGYPPGQGPFSNNNR